MSSKISGMGLIGLEKRSLEAHHRAFDNDLTTLQIGGFYSFRKGEEKHSFDATAIHILQMLLKVTVILHTKNILVLYMKTNQ